MAATMKLMAFQARWESSQNVAGKSSDLDEAQKHARDVFRIVAMETEEERRNLQELRQHLEQQELYHKCQIIVDDYFSAPGRQGFDFTSRYWHRESQMAIAQELRLWFAL